MIRAVTVKDAQINRLKVEIKLQTLLLSGQGEGFPPLPYLSIRREITDCFNIPSHAAKQPMTTGTLLSV